MLFDDSRLNASSPMFVYKMFKSPELNNISVPRRLRTNYLIELMAFHIGVQRELSCRTGVSNNLTVMRRHQKDKAIAPVSIVRLFNTTTRKEIHREKNYTSADATLLARFRGFDTIRSTHAYLT